MRDTVERRMAPEGGLAQRLAWPLRVSRASAWKLALLGVWLTGLADFLTGSEIWFGPVYLLAIGLAAWSLGWLEAIAVGLACLGITLAANGYELYPYSGIAGAWNITVRVLAVLALIGLLHTVRQLYAREWRVSRTDLLTGAFNRKAFFELTGNRTSSRRWSMLVYVDLDGFKALNDPSGHAAGDQCLARFADGVTKIIRTGDIFARLGGDEFAIYLDLKDQAAAKAVVVRLHRSMNDLMIADCVSVRCSVGALILQPGPRSIDAEVRTADFLMYEAKELGASLVAGTATQRVAGLSIERHWDLTPEVQDDDLAAHEHAQRQPVTHRISRRERQLVRVA
jgi:diguanylate cyclase (GGDEF)-like protein